MAVRASEGRESYTAPAWRGLQHVGLAPRRRCALAWLAGVALQLQQRAAVAARRYARAARRRRCVAACSRVALASARRRRSRSLSSALALRWLRAAPGWRASARLAERCRPRSKAATSVVTGVVAQPAAARRRGLRFRFEVESATRAATGGTCRRALPLGWYGGFHEDAALSQPQRELRAGQRWRFTLRLRQPARQR